MLLYYSHEGQVRHYHIKVDEDKKFYISEKHRFITIGDLIDYHKHNGGGQCVYECACVCVWGGGEGGKLV